MTAWCVGFTKLESVDQSTFSRYAVYFVIFVLGMKFSMRIHSVTNDYVVFDFRMYSLVLVCMTERL